MSCRNCVSRWRVGVPAQMLAAEQFRRLFRNGVAIAAHGKTHAAFPVARDVATELLQPRRVLSEILAADAICALSFPHGAYTPEIARQATREGHQLMSRRARSFRLSRAVD